MFSQGKIFEVASKSVKAAKLFCLKNSPMYHTYVITIKLELVAGEHRYYISNVESLVDY